MSEHRHGTHTVFAIHLHVVWITKYRKPVLQREVAYRVRELIRQICQSERVEIIKGHMSKDYIHRFLSILPQVTNSRLVQRLKGRVRINFCGSIPN